MLLLLSSVEPALRTRRGALPPGGPAGQRKVFPPPLSVSVPHVLFSMRSEWCPCSLPFTAHPLVPLSLTFSKVSFITPPSILTPVSCLHNLFFLKWLFTHGSLYTGQTSQLTHEVLQLLPTLVVQPNSGQRSSCPRELSRKLL